MTFPERHRYSHLCVRGECKQGQQCRYMHPYYEGGNETFTAPTQHHGSTFYMTENANKDFTIRGAAKADAPIKVASPQNMMDPQRRALLLGAQEATSPTDHAVHPQRQPLLLGKHEQRHSEEGKMKSGEASFAMRTRKITDTDANIIPLKKRSIHFTEERDSMPHHGQSRYSYGQVQEGGRKVKFVPNLKLNFAKTSEAARFPRTPILTTPPSPLHDNRSFSSTSSEMSMAPATPRERNERSQNGVGGPHPSYIQVANPYIFEQKVQGCLTALGSSETKEDNARLQGVLWIDSVRKALQLPVRTFNTAVVYYHKFRLVHADNEYMFLDAAAAALFTACKIEDTLKKSREILCAAYNLKATLSEQVSTDDQIFEQSSKTVVGLERLMLESAGFDFRNRHPQKYVVKLIREWRLDQATIGKTAYSMCIDIYRTFAPLKQTAPTLAFACVELAARMFGNVDPAAGAGQDGPGYKKWSTSREEVMETIHDLLDLYTHHPKATIVGLEHPNDSFINTRITLNKEASSVEHARYTEWISTKKAAALNGATNGSKLSPSTPVSDNKSAVPSPHSPPAMGPTSATGARSRVGERSKDGMVRFMLHAQKARDEKDAVAKYFAPDEWEEVEEEVEVPVEQQRSR